MKIAAMTPVYFTCVVLSTFLFTTFLIFHFASSFNTVVAEQQNCSPRNYGWNSVVCVCNSSYCDDIGEVQTIPNGYLTVYTSSKSGFRFDKQTYELDTCPERENSENTQQCVVNLGHLKQSILGFGGSFTDAAAININNLSSATRDKLMMAYFSPLGIEYTVCRIPMAATDFSTHFYTYQDDPEKPFGLAEEDLSFKIPLIRMANSMSNKSIRYFGSPWGSPLWLREQNNLGVLNSSKYEDWAEYFVEFVKAYEEHGVELWGLTSQNEPIFATFIHEILENSPKVFLYYSPAQIYDFTTKFLSPALRSHNYNGIKLMNFDDNSPLLSVYNAVINYRNNGPTCDDAIDGIAFHWYLNKYMNFKTTLSEQHETCPQKFLLSTEACTGVGGQVHVQLGNWDNAEKYAYDIIKTLQNWVVGWVDWNLALDEEGGPNWLNNFVDSPIIVNATEDAFYKQPMYYALGHFSKFLPPGFRVVDVSCQIPDEAIELVAAVKDLDDTINNYYPYNFVLVALNRGNDTKSVTLEVKKQVCLQVPASSIQTYMWNI